MRAFVAIELPGQIRDYLKLLQEKLNKSGADVKWVEPGNIHLTLKFLGEIDDKKLGEVSGILDDAVKGRLAFNMRVCAVGAFPKIDYPRVIWAGIDKGNTQIQEIAGELEERMASIGIAKENREFSCHITIGRARSALNREKLVQILKTPEDNLSAKNLEFLVAKITLFKSTLSPKGPVYETLKQAILKAA